MNWPLLTKRAPVGTKKRNDLQDGQYISQTRQREGLNEVLLDLLNLLDLLDRLQTSSPGPRTISAASLRVKRILTTALVSNRKVSEQVPFENQFPLQSKFENNVYRMLEIFCLET